MTKLIHMFFIFLLLFLFVSCENQQPAKENNSPSVSFNPETLKIPDTGGKKLRGQVLYLPVYSNIPDQSKQQFDLSAFLAIHNTDLKNKIKITKIDFFNTEGKLIKSFISSDKEINPLATLIITIPQSDQSGTGANFLVEWIADKPVNEPLIESIMKDLSGNKGLAFLSTGRVIREIK
ncbi:MAG: DUF3124 domain-containing protein [Smithella sp.]